MATKISELTNLTTVAGADLVVVVDEVANSSAIETKKVTVNNFFNGLGVTTGNGISGSVSGNNLTITGDSPLINKIEVTDTRVTSQSNTAPYGNTSSTVSTNAVATANSSTVLAKSPSPLVTIELLKSEKSFCICLLAIVLFMLLEVH